MVADDGATEVGYPEVAMVRSLCIELSFSALGCMGVLNRQDPKEKCLVGMGWDGFAIRMRASGC